MGKIAGSIDAIIWASNVMKYAIIVLALVGVLASPRPAAALTGNDLLCGGFQFARLVFDKLALDFKLEAIGLVFVFNNVVYNIEDFTPDASD